MKTEEIDIVLAWVDGSDLYGRKEKGTYETAGISVKSDDREDRYRMGSDALLVPKH